MDAKLVMFCSENMDDVQMVHSEEIQVHFQVVISERPVALMRVLQDDFGRVRYAREDSGSSWSRMKFSKRPNIGEKGLSVLTVLTRKRCFLINANQDHRAVSEAPCFVVTARDS